MRIEKTDFYWEKDQETPNLKDIELRVPHGSLVAIIGQVGSGKSSMLQAMLGEMERKKNKGRVVLSGSTSYVAQEAWIQNATLKENILFGLPFDHNRYEKALENCALKPDLEILPGGDQVKFHLVSLDTAKLIKHACSRQK